MTISLEQLTALLVREILKLITNTVALAPCYVCRRYKAARAIQRGEYIFGRN